jgi:hypothetical protein
VLGGKHVMMPDCGQDTCCERRHKLDIMTNPGAVSLGHGRTDGRVALPALSFRSVNPKTWTKHHQPTGATAVAAELRLGSRAWKW